MSDEVTIVLERLANLFEMAGETNWTSQQIADVLRRHAIDRDLPLTNRDDEGREEYDAERSHALFTENSRRMKDEGKK